MPGLVTAPSPQVAYTQSVARLQQAFAALPAGTPVRLGKTTSNLFRPRARTCTRLDVSDFSGVLELDPHQRWADVLGMTTYEDLVDATLPHGLMPLVVPQLKTITLGGAVTGLGVESTSFRNGAPHESVLEMDILTGDGRVVTARPEGEHRDLFFGFPNSYGSLGYALRLRIELEPVRPVVHVVHERFDDADKLTDRVMQLCAPGPERPDFLDGTAFTPDEMYLTVGRWADTAPRPPSDYTYMDIYYRSLQQRGEDWLSVRDYLWRWDTDWFWNSRAFFVQRPWVRRLVGRKRLRSDTYWKIKSYEDRWRLKARLDHRRGQPAREDVVQDVEVPVDRLPELLAFLDELTGIRPVWICPMQGRDERRWPLYDMDPHQLWVNVGFWSTVALPAGEGDGFYNRRIEREVALLGGHKSLYSTAFYEPDEFRARYGGEHYDQLKSAYDPEHRLLDLYDKTVRRR
jgi:FAD/FMN-containing dehydrogenase